MPEETVPEETATIAAFVPNLMDRSRFGGSQVTFVTSAEAASDSGANLLIVDLDRCDDPGSFRLDRVSVIGFGSHVDVESAAAAVEIGFDEVLARSVFFPSPSRDLGESLMATKKSRPLLEAPHLGGRAYLRAHSFAADDFLANLLADVVDDTEGLALVAVGGYGRQQLYPKSDLDLILVHNKRRDIKKIAEDIWYPIWDRGLKLGHGVFTIAEAVDTSRTELERATSFLTTRLIGGDDDLHNEFDRKVVDFWHKNSESMLERLAGSVHDRHVKSGEAAFQIEPELKEGKGGLRDLHSLLWAERALEGFSYPFFDEMRPHSETLAAARVELHRITGRSGNRVTLDDQDEMAEALGYPSGQDLMLRIAQAARRIAWNTDEAWDPLAAQPPSQPAHD